MAQLRTEYIIQKKEEKHFFNIQENYSYWRKFSDLGQILWLKSLPVEKAKLTS